MRKFISLLSAAAVLASVAVVPITASAEDVFTYDDGDTSGWTAGDSNLKITTESDNFGEYVKLTVTGSSTYSTSYALPAAAQLSDNYVIEYDIMYHQSNGMGRYGRYTQAAFISSDATQDTNDFGTYAATLGTGNTASETGQGYVTGVASSVTSIFGITSALVNYDGTAPVPSDDATGMLSDVWYRVQTVVSGNTATMTVIDGQGNKVIDGVDYTNSASALNSIFVTVGRGDADQTGGGVVALDNVRIYEGSAEDLKTDGLRRALETYTVTYMVDDAEYQTASVIEGNTVATIPDVPEKEGFIGSWTLEDGTAFTKSTVITGDTVVYAQYAAKIEAVAKAAVLLEGDELRISDGTQGAVFRFEIADYIPAGEELESASLIIKAAPRSYDGNNARWGNTSIYTYKVNSAWNGSTNEISGDSWNGLSKGDPISTIWTSVYQDGTGTAVAPYQTLAAQDVTDKIGSDGVAIFAFKTTSARTHAIDAYLTITTKEPGEPEPVEIVTPEPASEVEGSFEAKALAPSNDWSTDFGTVEGTASEVLNHSDANAVAAGDVNVYVDTVNYRGKSIYALYDVLVNAGDKVTLQLYNKTDLGTTFTLTGNEDGTATAAALVNKGDSVTVGNVVCGTWYRVLIEVPQVNNEGATNTGNATYTIYRIDKADPTKVSEVAVAKEGLTPRNLSGKALTTLRFSADGTPYIDNGVAFVKAGGYSLIDSETPASQEPVATEDPNAVTLEASAKAATKVENDELRISDGTNGAVFRFDVSEYDGIEAAKLVVKAAPRTYDSNNVRWANAEISTYKVSTTWNGEGNIIENDTWNGLSKGDPINKQYTKTYPDATGENTPPYQTLNAIDVTDIVTADEDGIIIFAFKTGSAREHAIEAELVITPRGESTWTLYKATKDENGVLTGITMTAVDDPAEVTLGDNEYLWDQYLMPYPAQAAE